MHLALHRCGLSLVVAVLLAAIGFGSGPRPSQAAPKLDCTKIRPGRPDVSALLRAGKAVAAIAVLEQTRSAQGTCDPSIGIPDAAVRDWYWLRSDLALSLLKAGRETECSRLLAEIDNPLSPRDVRTTVGDDDAVVRALDANIKLCGKAHEARRAGFTAPACSFTVPGAITTVAAPSGSATCLALMPGADETAFAAALKDEKSDDAGALCPRIVFADSKGGRTRVTVEPGPNELRPGPLSDTSSCCNVNSIRVAKVGDQWLARIQGAIGRDCFGGTAQADSDAVYRLEEGKLILLEDDSIGYH